MRRLILVAIATLLGAPSYADETGWGPSRAKADLTLYEGHGVDADLLELPGDLWNRSVEWDPAHFTGLGYIHSTRTPDWLAKAFALISVGSVSTGVELLGVQHRGLQDHFEANLAYTVRTSYLILGPIQTRFGFSAGISYAFGRPGYEDGPKNHPERRYRFQNFNAYELEWGVRRYPRVSLVTRVHHRSGVYGLIAPRRVGSNFLAIGIRIKSL